VSLLGIAVESRQFDVVIRLSGEADLSTVGQLRDALDGQISGGARQLTIDLSGLRFADSSSIRALTDAHLALKAQGGTLELVHPQANVARILVLLGIDQVLTVRPQPDSGTAGAGLGCRLRRTAADRRISGCRRRSGAQPHAGPRVR
jgi:anti-sigma B factor antagonist